MALLKVHAVAQKIRKTLIVVCLGLKQTVCQSLNELKLLVKRKKQDQKVRPLYPTHKRLKSEKWAMAVLRYQRQKQNGLTTARILVDQ